MLVSYSDSEGSEDEQKAKANQNPPAKPSAIASNSNFAIDRSTGKIKVNLQNKPVPPLNGTHEDEPAAKRPRLGGGAGAFHGFNAMLPAPKRDNLPVTKMESKAPARKVFSLRTGAEPAFSRESDAELRELFAEQDSSIETNQTTTEPTIPNSIPKPSFAKPAPPAPVGKPFMFKPLSIARNTKKKRPASTPSTHSVHAERPKTGLAHVESLPPPKLPEKKKINLFSAESDNTSSIPPVDDEDEIIEDLGPIEPEDSLDFIQPDSTTLHQSFSQVNKDSQSLDSIANDLNLSAAERRQLFGRGGKGSAGSAINVVNFNTDAEYAANQQLIASGEQVQHNPVRAIASGKHSLRQLVSSAANQKEALEESFAQGKRNKKEAGNKYGW